MAGQTEQVLNAILDGIDRGHLNPGDYVEETALMAEHKVSRTPVREALIQLSSLGLIRRLPRKGAVLFKPTLEEFIALLEIKVRLEGQAAGLAARRLSRANADRLEAAAAACERLAEDEAFSDPDRYHRHDLEFHEVVANSSGNVFLADLIRTTGRQLAAYYRTAHRYPGSIPRSAKEHRELVELITSRRAEEAEELMCRHVGFDHVTVLDLLATLD